MTKKDLEVYEKSVTEYIDPAEESFKQLMVVLFPKSNSKNYPFALSVAQSATRYGQLEFKGKPANVAAFAKNKEDASRARILLEYAAGWKGTVIFINGQIEYSAWSVQKLLACYLKSCSCNDHKAHCFSIIDDPRTQENKDYSMGMSINLSFGEPKSPKYFEEIEIDEYIFPCKFLNGYFKFDLQHPSSFKDQIQAAAVDRGCSWCPHFDENNFQKIRTRKEKKEVFE